MYVRVSMCDRVTANVWFSVCLCECLWEEKRGRRKCAYLCMCDSKSLVDSILVCVCMCVWASVHMRLYRSVLGGVRILSLVSSSDERVAYCKWAMPITHCHGKKKKKKNLLIRCRWKREKWTPLVFDPVLFTHLSVHCSLSSNMASVVFSNRCCHNLVVDVSVWGSFLPHPSFMLLFMSETVSQNAWILIKMA